ncbi:VOC family protein [soil metagenome]
MTSATSIKTSIAPWLAVKNGAQAVEFYKAAFNAVELHRLEDPDGNVVSQLAIDGVDFWLSDDPNNNPETLNGITSRIILTVADPDALFAQAIEAGATEVFPVGEGHGWRLGRLADPFGHHWEIGHLL